MSFLASEDIKQNILLLGGYTHAISERSYLPWYYIASNKREFLSLEGLKARQLLIIMQTDIIFYASQKVVQIFQRLQLFKYVVHWSYS